MGAETRSSAFDVAINSLAETVRGISFYQLNQLFQRCIALVNEFDSTVIRFTANRSLAFPASDVDAVTIVRTPRHTEVHVNVTFMGLFGPSSPLPAFYTERLLHTEDESNASAQFLDIFNHHLISLLQSAWEKYRYYIRYESDATDDLSKWVFHLIGIDNKRLLDQNGLDWTKLLPVASLMAAKVKNATTLKAIIEAYFDSISLSIEECVQRQVNIPHDQMHRMGSVASTMGFDLVLGDELTDRMGKYRIHIYCDTEESYQRFLPTETAYTELTNLISSYMRDQLDYDICLHLEGGKCVTGSMGDNSMTLGWNSCMGEANSGGEMTVVI